MRMRRTGWLFLFLVGAGFATQAECELEARLLAIGDVEQCSGKALLTQKADRWTWEIQELSFGGAAAPEAWRRQYGERFFPPKNLLLKIQRLAPDEIREKRRLRVDLGPEQTLDLLWEKDLPEGIQVQLDGRWELREPVPLPHGPLLNAPEAVLPLQWSLTGTLLYDSQGNLKEATLTLRAAFLGASEKDQKAPEEKKEPAEGAVVPPMTALPGPTAQKEGAANDQGQENEENPPSPEANQNTEESPPSEATEAEPKAPAAAEPEKPEKPPKPNLVATLRALGFSYEWKVQWKIQWTESEGNGVSAAGD